MKSKHVALQCFSCGEISIFKEHMSDGRNCLFCKGPTKPIGNAIIYDQDNKNKINIKVSVDTTEIDSALEKIERIRKGLEG